MKTPAFLDVLLFQVIIEAGCSTLLQFISSVLKEILWKKEKIISKDCFLSSKYKRKKYTPTDAKELIIENE